MKNWRFRSELYVLFVFYLVNLSLYGQDKYSIEAISHIPMPELSSSVWGLSHSTGKEIALLGTRKGLRIYDLSDPKNPQELKFITGNDCIWREIKTYRDFVYLVTECEDGLLIVDCRDLGNIQFHYQHKFTNPSLDTVVASRSHTLFIDEKAYLYLSGTPEGPGYVCLDLKNNPLDPEYVSKYSSEYFHEAFVLRDTIYGASLYTGEFTVMDIRDRKNPVLLARQKTGYNFTHSVWREENRAVLYVADEVSGAFIEAWDISDLSRIKLLDKFRPNFPTDNYSIPHNCFFKDNFLFVSWYTEGIRILDISNPNNLVEVGYYDTYPARDQGFHGVWNVYPFFNSGTILASDIENGMFVFSFQKNTATYLEGKITDKIDGSPIFNATISISSSMNKTTEYSDLLGNYRTGAGQKEVIDIQISKPGYFPISDRIILPASGIIQVNIELTPLPKYNVKLHTSILPASTDEAEVKIKIWNKDFTYEGVTDSTGKLDLNDIVQGTYLLQTSKWGRLHHSIENLQIEGTKTIQIDLKNGYEDHFNIAQNWQMLPELQKLKWRRGNFSELFPKPSNYPSKDIDSDLGDQALYTSNFDDFDSENNVVGHSYLISPEMDLSQYDRINLKYTAWAYGGWDSAIKETYILVNDGLIPLEGVLEDLSGNWNPTSDFTLDLKEERSKSYFVMHLYNDPDSVKHAITLKAAIDGFRLTGEKITQTIDVTASVLNVFPVPFEEVLYFENNNSNPINVEVYNFQGKMINEFELKANSNFELNTSQLFDNFYFYKSMNNQGGNISTGKLFKFSK